MFIRRLIAVSVMWMVASCAYGLTVQKPLKIVNRSKRSVQLTVMSPRKASGSKVSEWHQLNVSVSPRQKSGQTTKTVQFLCDDDLPIVYKIKESGFVNQSSSTLRSSSPVDRLACDINESGKISCTMPFSSRF